jgi:type I restriction enzyme S subunit
LVDPEYAQLVFRAYQHTGRFREIARITTNLAHLGVRRFAELEFPLRPLAEQRDIVRIAGALIGKIRESTQNLALLRDEVRGLIGAFERAALSGLLSHQSELETAPAITAPDKADRARTRPGPSRPHVAIVVRTKEMPTIPLVDALTQSARALDGQELFKAAGYPEDASILQVEQFFLELRGAVADGRIQRTTGDGEHFASTGSGR